MPRGSAFLQFAEKTSADSVLAQGTFSVYLVSLHDINELTKFPVALYASQFALASDSTSTKEATAAPGSTSKLSSNPKAVLSTTVGKSGIFMEGRELIIDRAVDRETATSQFTAEKKKEKEEHDKRNLYLANEGCASFLSLYFLLLCFCHCAHSRRSRGEMTDILDRSRHHPRNG